MRKGRGERVVGGAVGGGGGGGGCCFRCCCGWGDGARVPAGSPPGKRARRARAGGEYSSRGDHGCCVGLSEQARGVDSSPRVTNRESPRENAGTRSSMERATTPKNRREVRLCCCLFLLQRARINQLASPQHRPPRRPRRPRGAGQAWPLLHPPPPLLHRQAGAAARRRQRRARTRLAHPQAPG